MYYRDIYESYGFEASMIKYKWLPTWCPDAIDSSASTIDVFTEDTIK
jgi:hypothetical protein